ncbi:MAG: hypothetical protein ACLTT3_03170 [Roseburia faecis]
MEAVDKLIEALAIHISEVISSDKEREHEVAEKTRESEYEQITAVHFWKTRKAEA